MPPKVPFNQPDFDRDWNKSRRRRIIGVTIAALVFVGAVVVLARAVFIR